MNEFVNDYYIGTSANNMKTATQAALNSSIKTLYDGITWQVSYPTTCQEAFNLKQGDRVRVREGYEGYGNGKEYYYVGRSTYDKNLVLAKEYGQDSLYAADFLAESLELVSLTPEEKALDSISIMEELLGIELEDNEKAVLHAVAVDAAFD